MSFHSPCFDRCALALITVFSLASATAAESVMGPVAALPAYPDETARTSSPHAASPLATSVPEPPPIIVPASLTQAQVVQASYQEPVLSPSEGESRRKLSAPSPRTADLLNRRDRPRDAASLIPSARLPADSLVTTATALAVVVGLFLTCVWAVKRGQQKSSGALPEGVVNVLGRVPLAGRQFAELVHVGNKLVLLSVTQHGVEPLTEVTDPAEIDRLLGMCRARQAKSTSTEFDQVFRQFAEEAVSPGFLGAEAGKFNRRSPADPFAAYQGGHGRA